MNEYNLYKIIFNKCFLSPGCRSNIFVKKRANFVILRSQHFRCLIEKFSKFEFHGERADTDMQL